MAGELVPVRNLKFRKQVPDIHRASLDTRLVWLWHQRFGTVQTIWNESRDVLDHTAATLILQAIIAKDLGSIGQLFQRLEGGALDDATLAERLVDEIRI
jgi:hypothetical protein